MKNSIGVPVVIDAACVLSLVSERVALRLDEASVGDEEPGIVAAVAVEVLEQVEPAAAALSVTEGQGHEVVAACQQ